MDRKVASMALKMLGAFGSIPHKALFLAVVFMPELII